MALSGLAACSSVSESLEPSRIDYKSDAKIPRKAGLDVPPDLTQLQRDNRYQVPEANSGIATASTYNAGKSANGAAAAAAPASVAVDKVGSMHIERDGSERWLVVKQSPEALWPQLRQFWIDSGFAIATDEPVAGIMETDWAENRAKIPSDILRNTLGKVFDSLWSTSERDKFRTRVERGTDGSSEIYISHRGVEEVATGTQKDGSTRWAARPVDPGLEAEFLSRLMARLGDDPALAKTAVANTTVEPAHAKLVKGADGSFVEVDEGFDHAWRRVGLALDRVGFTVEDRDRTQGLYFVRYADEKDPAGEKGFFSKIFSWGSDDAAKAQKYRISIKESGAITKIVVQDNDGKPETTSTGEKILGLLNDQLK